MSQNGNQGTPFTTPRRSNTPIQSPSGQERAIVLAPHQDDESLGCGGRVIQLLNSGAEVTVVYTSDGRLANSQFMDEDEIVRIRQKEAVDACAVLGLPEENVIFLPFHDGSLPNHVVALAAELGEIFKKHQPTEIYLPYIRDFHPDHEATSQAARAAVQTHGQSVTAYEYLVWGIYHWPWITIPKSGPQKKLALKNTIKELFGFRVRRAYKKAEFAEIKDVKEQKLEALMKHTSQVSRLVDNPEWMTLSDVADGSWLKQFQTDYEVFKKTEF